MRRSQRRPSGNWYAFAATESIRTKPVGTSVAGIELVAWRGQHGTLHVGPGACPHLGAELATGKVDCGTLICPWHGLRLDGSPRFGWRAFPSHDDGVMAWVRLDSAGAEPATDIPVLGARPDGARLHAVTRLVGTCEPRDIIANRMDPWHGSWFHPYSFTRLEVLTHPPVDEDVPDEFDRFLVAVTFRIGRLGIPVVAEFTSPEPRTIVMRIVDGEGSGSVVETHATPLGRGPDGLPRTAVLEAVIAHSDRPGFLYALRGAATDHTVHAASSDAIMARRPPIRRTTVRTPKPPLIRSASHSKRVLDGREQAVRVRQHQCICVALLPDELGP